MTAFTKQHYKAIATLIRASTILPFGIHKEVPQIHSEPFVVRLSDFFEADNPLFDRKKFWEACFKEVHDAHDAS